MSSIICATRAGEGSRAVQLAAIDQAKANGQNVVFLYIIETDQINRVDESLRSSMRAELYWLAKTLLRIAEQRALSAGVRAELLTREGQIRDEINQVVLSSDANCLLLGAPRQNKTDKFDTEEIEAFAQSIAEFNGITVKIIRPSDNNLGK